MKSLIFSKFEQVSFYKNGVRWGPIIQFRIGGGAVMGMANGEGELTGDDVIYAYPDYKTLLVGKFSKGVMMSAKQSFATGIVFDDVSGIPMLLPSQVLNSGNTFSYDEADAITISNHPTLQGMNNKICNVNRIIDLS